MASGWRIAGVERLVQSGLATAGAVGLGQSELVAVTIITSTVGLLLVVKMIADTQPDLIGIQQQLADLQAEYHGEAQNCSQMANRSQPLYISRSS